MTLFSGIWESARGAIRSLRRKPEPFPGSEAYWERRYSGGGNSGVGSYGLFAAFKAEVLNGFVAGREVRTVIEFGCGDGHQLGLARYPQYLGFDVSSTVIARCRDLFKADPHKSFRPVAEYDGETAELALSLDVIFHLVEDDIFERYMRTLFAAAERYVIIYSSDTDDNSGHDGVHVRHRNFTKWVELNVPDWKLVTRVPNRYPYKGDFTTGSFADFFVFERR